MNCFLVIDQGTTSTRLILVDSKTFAFLYTAQKEHKQYYPIKGYVEHDLEEIWNNIIECAKNIYSYAEKNKLHVVGMGITNQRETTCCFDSTGKALAPAIVWQDIRTSEYCNRRRSDYEKNNFKQRTGLPLDPYFSATKMKWFLDNVAKSSELKLGTMDTFLLYKLTKGKSFATDTSNASRTMLLNLHTLKWDPELLNFFQIKEKNLPVVQDTVSHFGDTNVNNIFGYDIPILCMIGDQQAALLGQGCMKEGDTKSTFGTGAFLLSNIGAVPKFSDKGLLTTVAFTSTNEKFYALEGSSYIAGAASQWLRDELKWIAESSEVTSILSEMQDISPQLDVYFLPYLTGAGAPHWRSDLQACWLGLTRSTKKEHMIAAVYEGILFELNELLELFQKEQQKTIQLHIDGGMTRNTFFCQLLADIYGAPYLKNKQPEATALGAAVGCYLNSAKLSYSNFVMDHQFEKISPVDTRKNLLAKKKDKWKKYQGLFLKA